MLSQPWIGHVQGTKIAEMVKYAKTHSGKRAEGNLILSRSKIYK